MKKLLSTLLALTLVASLASCGDSKDSSSGKSDTSSSSSSEKTEDAEETSLSEEESAKAFEKIAGTYYMTGHSLSEYNKSGKFENIYEYQDMINEEGITISKDGVLHIDGEDYQLLAQKYEEKLEDNSKTTEMIFSVKGCGFSLKDYEALGNKTVDKDYEGFIALRYFEQTPNINDEDLETDTWDTWTSIQLDYSTKGEEVAPISILIDTYKPDKANKEPMSDEENLLP